MSDIDLFSLREGFENQRIRLCFNGPISRSLIEEIGNALKNYLQGEEAGPGAVLDVFGVYVEMTQNIRHYAHRLGYGDELSSTTVVVARQDNGHYLVEACNVVEAEDGEVLLARIEELAAMDHDELKAAYKRQLRAPREGTASGAGLGLIDIARRSAKPLSAKLKEAGDGRRLFSLRAVVGAQ